MWLIYSTIVGYAVIQYMLIVCMIMEESSLEAKGTSTRLWNQRLSYYGTNKG